MTNNPRTRHDELSARDAAADARARAAGTYKPDRIELLLVAESPPTALDRYFYFEDVREQDSLFRYVCRGVLEVEPTRNDKGSLLRELAKRGVFLIDLKEDPTDETPLAACVSGVVERATSLDPRGVILIKATVFDLVYRPLRDAGLNVSDVRIPFPGSGRQREFEAAFGRALRQMTHE